jgi:hypothetical protein
MRPLRAVFFAFMALCIVFSIISPALTHGIGSHDDEDEFGEYDEFESMEVAGTAMPYIPETDSTVADSQSKATKKHSRFDDEEFEGVSIGIAESEKDQTMKPVVDQFAATASVTAPFAYNYLVEIGSVAFLACFAVNYLIGRKTNEKIASAFARTFRDLFSAEFSVVGVNGAVLVKESQHTFRLNATGRPNVQGIQANLRLTRRQDLVARLYNQFWAPNRDVLDIQIAMNDEALDSIVFALAKNRDARTVSKEFPDLTAYTKSVKIPQEGTKSEATLDNDVWTAFAEAKEVVGLLFDHPTRVTLNRYKDQIRFIHITDKYSEHKEYKKVLHLVFYLPPVDQMEELRTLLKFTFHLIDLVAKAKLPAAVKASVEKARSKIVTDEQKEKEDIRREELEQKKLEKRREKMKGMDANERADFEEKERARKMNKKIKKMSVKA